MSKELVLQHLLSRGIIEPSKRCEVLSAFPKQTAVAVSMAVVSSFAGNDRDPTLETQFSIDWTLQCVSYCLSLPTRFAASIENSMAIFRNWLKSPTFFSDTEQWNTYARTMFRHLSQIFEYGFDGGDSTDRVRLIAMVLDDFDRYHTEIPTRFSEETWNVLTRIIIGSCDFLMLKDDVANAERVTGRPETLIGRNFSLAFAVLCDSGLTLESIWGLFMELCQSWRASKVFLECWGSHICVLYAKVLEKLFAKERNDEELKLVGFQLQKFVQVVDVNAIVDDPKLVLVIAKTMRTLYKLSRDCARKSDTLYWPLFPSSVLFRLFGKFCLFPLGGELNTGHRAMVRLLLDIASKWAEDEGWSPLVKSTILSIMSRCNDAIRHDLIKKGRALVCRHSSPEFVRGMTYVIAGWKPGHVQKPSFWQSYAIVLMSLSETTLVSSDTLLHFLRYSCSSKANLDVLSILMKSDAPTFVDYVRKTTQTCQTAVYAHEMSGGIGHSGLEIVRTVCYMVAGAPAFLDLKCVPEFLASLLDCVSRNMRTRELPEAFMCMVASLSRWRDEIFEQRFAVPFLDMLVNLGERDGVDGVQRLMHGRAVNRTYQKVDASELLVSFVAGGCSIISIYGDAKRSDSIIFHVRNCRGFFMWEIEDRQLEDLRAIKQRSQTLPDAAKDQMKEIDHDYTSYFDTFAETLAQMSTTSCVDTTYAVGSKHDEESRILIHKMQAIDKMTDEAVAEHPWLHYRLRHKAIDFLIQSGLSQWVERIDDDVDTVLREFDNIEHASILQLQVVRKGTVDADPETQRTDLFDRFMSLLGTKNPESTREVQMGLLTLRFSDSFERHKLASIVFVTSSLELNKRHSSIVRSDLTIFVQPVDDKFYRVSGITRESSVWCGITSPRLVHCSNLSSVLCMAIFTFVIQKRCDLLFTKDEERSAFISRINRSPVDILALADNASFEAFLSSPCELAN